MGHLEPWDSYNNTIILILIRHTHVLLCVTFVLLYTLRHVWVTFQRCTERLMKDYDNFMTMPVDAFADLQTTVANYQEFKVVD